MIHLHLDSNRDESPFVTDKAGKPLERNPLKDARVRKAISKAINRKAIVERVMEGLAMPAGQLVPEGFFGVSRDLSPSRSIPKARRSCWPKRAIPTVSPSRCTAQQPLRERRADRAGGRADADPRRHRDQGRDAAVLGLRFTRRQSSSSARAGRLGRLHGRGDVSAALAARDLQPGQGPGHRGTGAAIRIRRWMRCSSRRCARSTTPSAKNCCSRRPSS